MQWFDTCVEKYGNGRMVVERVSKVGELNGLEWSHKHTSTHTVTQATYTPTKKHTHTHTHTRHVFIFARFYCKVKGIVNEGWLPSKCFSPAAFIGQGKVAQFRYTMHRRHDTPTHLSYNQYYAGHLERGASQDERRRNSLIKQRSSSSEVLSSYVHSVVHSLTLPPCLRVLFLCRCYFF